MPYAYNPFTGALDKIQAAAVVPDQGEWGAPVAVQIGALGVLTLAGPGNYTVSAETGSAGDLVEVEGLSPGDEVILGPASGHTITITAGAIIKMKGDWGMDSDDDAWRGICVSAGVMRQLGRSDNA